MSLVRRSITIEIDERADGVLVVKSHLKDDNHDIRLTLDVARSDFTIVDVDLDMVRTPQEGCRLIYPIAKQLIGTGIRSGFNRAVAGILAGGRGCPNILNMVLVSAPLAINASHMPPQAGTDSLPAGGHHVSEENVLRGVCIAHP